MIENKLTCNHEMLELENFEPHPRNANQHSQEGIEAIAGNLRAQGWRKPIVRSRQTGLCTKGHGRYYAAQQLGETHYPCQWQDYESPEAEMEDLLADNQLALETQVKAAQQQKLLRELEERGQYTGHTEEEVEAALKALGAQARSQDKKPALPREEFTTVRLHFLPDEHRKIQAWLNRQGTGPQNTRFLDGLKRLTPQIK